MSYCSQCEATTSRTCSGWGEDRGFQDMQLKNPAALDSGPLLEPDIYADRCLHTAPDCERQEAHSCCFPPLWDFPMTHYSTRPGRGSQVSDLACTTGIPAEFRAKRQGQGPWEYQGGLILVFTRHQSHQSAIALLPFPILLTPLSVLIIPLKS